MDLIKDFLSNVDIIEFIENNLYVNGEKMLYRTNGRYFIAEIMRYIAHTMVRCKDAKPVIVLKGRQVGMSTASMAIMLYYLYSERNKSFLHAFPYVNVARRFSSGNFSEFLQSSMTLGGLPKDFLDKKGTQSLIQRDFKGNNRLYIEGMGTDARRIRSLTITGLCIFDEFSLANIDAYKNTLEASSSSKFPRIDNGRQIPHVMFGTPLSEGSLFHKFWERSDKREFHLKCPNCGRYVLVYYDVDVNDRNICKTNLESGYNVVCRDRNGDGCGHVFDKRYDAMINGKWISTLTQEEKQRNLDRYGSEYQFVGFYVPQYMLKTKEEIDFKRLNDNPQNFFNEVLGRFYTSSSDINYTIDIIREYTNNKPDTSDWDIVYAIRDRRTYMGIDWGLKTQSEIASGEYGSYTTIVIISEMQDGKIKVEYAERLNINDYDQQIEYIEELARRYNTYKICADRGAGEAQRYRLTKIFGDVRFFAAQWEGFTKFLHRYDQQNNIVTTNKNAFFDEFFDMLRQYKICIPNSQSAEEKVEFLYEHISNIDVKTKEYNGQVRKIYERKGNKQIDGLAALLFAYTALLVDKTNYFKNGSFSNSDNYNISTKKQTHLSNGLLIPDNISNGSKYIRWGRGRQ